MSTPPPPSSSPPPDWRAAVAVMLGQVSALHACAKTLEAHGVVEGDMVACQLEDVFATLEPLLGTVTPAQALSLNG